MYSHIMLGSNDQARSKSFYDAVFGALGAKPGRTDDKGRLLYLHNGGLFMVTTPIDGEPATCGNGSTIGFTCDSTAQVDAWHAAGVAGGGTSIEDPPGVRTGGFGSLYLAYLRDPDGNKLCGLFRVWAEGDDKPMGSLDITPASTLDYRRLSERRLPRFLFDYIDGGANDERTMRANVEDFARVRLQQRVLRDVGGIDTATTVLGERLAMPLALAPVGMAGMMARRGEVIGARAAKRTGIPFTLSTVGICALEEVRAATTAPFWFQLYMLRDRGAVTALLDRAVANGCGTLVFTVDLPVSGVRHRDARNGMDGIADLGGRLRAGLDLLCHPAWIHDVGLRGRPHSFGNIAPLMPGKVRLAEYKHWIDSNFDPTVTWRDIEWLRGIWRGKLLVKGILNAEDARAAVAAGADGIIVSNHGGRQLDGVSSSIAALPAIAQAVGTELEVLMDGGVRSGVDVLRAVALGARAVLIGRPWVWAASARGEAGLTHLLSVFRTELEIAMTLTGVTRIEQIGPGLIA